MGLFSEKPNADYSKLYMSIQPYLIHKDGASHVVIFNVNAVKDSGCITDMTVQENYIISKMQNAGYEILDVKPIPKNIIDNHTIQYMVQILYR